MATYKKRGYKPETKAEKQEFDEQESTTAEVFSSLDEGASRSEEWVSRNQNYILGAIGVIAISVLGYLAYSQFVVKPKETSAANEMYYPQQYFDQALTSTTAKDSLFTLALEGAEGKYGFKDIIEEYSGTQAANLANYGAGMSYLNMNKYQEAINYLENFSSDDAILGALAKGGLGDAFMQLDQPEDALGYYEAAVAHSTNDYTTPKFLYKAGVTALEMGDKDKALGFFQRIKDEYPKSENAGSIDAFIGMAKSGA
ncbi:tetratricopeptide repeat protein [Maribacter confluentis]|uniref:Tetratricopeptide repeat-containing protein n=2 Tax=Maribacter TaxID=252356 RepID=A0ABY1SK35_9FLAO|nr:MULTISPECIES: tetratricopeptide repeat protein [Maribacter]MDO1514237.1 tetratricopeptide repeat protein [Maribacter confluentis]SNR67961.1 Tetratricopeptide repeat-containing protein [Maribacter sedimenticola]